jgi:Na+/H+ antiporter NhaD/arsenite permease-like protein
VTYDVIASVIFVIMSFLFFFPMNRWIPLERRTTATVCATLCYVTRSFLFPDNKMNLEGAVDWDVIILLSAIMGINFIMLNQAETKNVILYVQNRIKEDPVKGFWLVSWAAFVTSPFLTNDGVCLLFVEPILNAFDGITDSASRYAEEGRDLNGVIELRKTDAFYFLLALACSTNIGSALTYTGNPQVSLVLYPCIKYKQILTSVILVEHDCFPRCNLSDAFVFVFHLHVPSLSFIPADHDILDSTLLAIF